MIGARLRWFEAAPARRLALLRILVGGFAVGYLVARSPHLASFGRFPDKRFDPVGVVGALTDPLPAGVVTWLVVAAIAAGVAFVAGWRFRFSGPLFALLLLWVTTYRNSFGVVLHTENLMALHVLVIGLVPAAAHAYSVDARRTEAPDDHWRYGWPIRLVSLVTVVAYFVSGWAKLRFGGLDWLFGDALRNQIALDNLQKLQLGDVYSPIGAWLSQYAWVFTPMALATVFIEVAAPLALLSARFEKLWVGGAYLFHLGVLVLMAIVFPYQLAFVSFASFFALEKGWDRVTKKKTAAQISQ